MTSLSALYCLVNEDSVPMAKLLRHTMSAAVGLQDSTMESWARAELLGYVDVNGSDVPSYRHLHTTVLVLNPVHGWQPLHGDHDFLDRIAKRIVFQSAPSIEKGLLEKDVFFHHEFPPRLQQELMGMMEVPLRPVQRSHRSDFSDILEQIRQRIFDWIASQPAFSSLEKNMASANTELETKLAESSASSTHNYYGACNSIGGAVSGSNFLMAGDNSLQTIGHSANESQEIQAFVDRLKKDLPALGLSVDAENAISSDMIVLEAMANAPAPRVSMMKEIVKSTRSVLENAVGGALGTVLTSAPAVSILIAEATKILS